MKKKYFIISVLILILLGISSVFIGYSENKFVNTIKILVPTPVKNFVKKNIFFVSDIRSELFRLKKNVNRQNTQIDYLKGQIQIQKKNTNYLLSELQSEKNFFVSPLISQNEKIQTENYIERSNFIYLESAR